MLDQHRVTVGELKQAYGLSEKEAQSLLDALSPDGIFPFALWHQAYTACWRDSVRHCARLYKLEVSAFPETGVLPEKHCPTLTYAKWMVDYFRDLAKVIPISELERGFDFLLEAAYGAGETEFTLEKENLFQLLRRDEEHIANHSRLEGKKRISVPDASFEFLLTMFPHTIVVNKAAAVRYLHSCGCEWQPGAKGLSHAIVEQILATPEPAETSEDSAIAIPAALWEGKTHTAVRDALREHDYTDSVIAYVLHHWCGLKNKTQIGKLLGPVGGQDDSASLRQAKKLLDESKNLSITKEG